MHKIVEYDGDCYLYSSSDGWSVWSTSCRWRSPSSQDIIDIGSKKQTDVTRFWSGPLPPKLYILPRQLTTKEKIMRAF